MEPLRDKDPRFKKLELKTGIMVLTAIAGIVLIIVFLGIERDLFTKKYSIHIVTDSGAGFIQGMPVRLSGFKIGRIKRLELIEGARVRLTAEINRKHQKWLRNGSVARLAKEGYIGDSYVEITMGDPEGGILEEGDTIPFEKKGGVEELINVAKPVLKEIKEIIHYLNDPEGDIKQMIGNMKDLSAELKDTRHKLHTSIGEGRVVIKKLDKLADKLDAKATPALDSAGRILTRFEELTLRLEPAMDRVDSITEDAAEAASTLPATARKVEGIVDDVKGLTGTFSEETPRIREMLSNADKTLRDGRSVVKGVKESWPVRLMLPPEKEPGFVPLDSFLFDGRDTLKRSSDVRR